MYIHYNKGGCGRRKCATLHTYNCSFPSLGPAGHLCFVTGPFSAPMFPVCFLLSNKSSNVLKWIFRKVRSLSFPLPSCFIFGLSTGKVANLKPETEPPYKLVHWSLTALQSTYKAGFDNTVREKMRQPLGRLGTEVVFFSSPSLFKFTLGSIWWQVVRSSWIGSGPDPHPRPPHMANLWEETVKAAPLSAPVICVRDETLIHTRFQHVCLHDSFFSTSFPVGF